MAETSQISDLRLLVLEQAIYLWRRRWLALSVCWAVCIIGWTVIVLMPRQYESDARVFVDVNGLLTPLLKGMVVDTSAGMSEDYLRRTLLSRPNLEKVIVLADLDPGNLSKNDKEVLVAHLERSASIEDDGQNLVKISYEGSSPVAAKNIVQALLTIFAETASSSSRIGMEKARKFLDNQIAHYSGSLHAAEERRAKFRKLYSEYLPDETSGAPRVTVLQQQVEQAQQEYDHALITRNSLAAQVHAAPQLLSVSAAPVAGPDGKLLAATPSMRLYEAQRTLAELRLQYTDSHPDVLAAKRDVTELEARVRAGHGSEGAAQISNPVYEQIRLKLVDAETALPAAKRKLDDAKDLLTKVKAMAAQLPEIEAKGQDLDRDYNVLKVNYDELIKRRESANLSQAADDQADRTQFRIVDPPNVPLQPSFPNIPLMASAVLLLGLAAGAAVPVGLAYARPTFSSMTRLRDVGLPVIGNVTTVRRFSDAATFSTNPLAVAAGGAALIILYAAILAINFAQHG